jgi:hypothetical protein
MALATINPASKKRKAVTKVSKNAKKSKANPGQSSRKRLASVSTEDGDGDRTSQEAISGEEDNITLVQDKDISSVVTTPHDKRDDEEPSAEEDDETELSP